MRRFNGAALLYSFVIGNRVWLVDRVGSWRIDRRAREKVGSLVVCKIHSMTRYSSGSLLRLYSTLIIIFILMVNLL